MSKQTSLSVSKLSSPRYDAAFKRRAAEQVLLHHHPVAQVARQLQCSPQSVANWVKQYQNDVRSNPSPNRASKHSPNPFPNHSPHSASRHSSQSSQNPLPKAKSTLPHPTGQTSSCQHKKPLSLCSRSAKPQSRRTTFLPIKVGEVSSLISHSESLMSCNESLMPRGEPRIEIVTQSGLVLRLPGETALEVLAGFVRQLESASC